MMFHRISDPEETKMTEDAKDSSSLIWESAGDGSVFAVYERGTIHIEPSKTSDGLSARVQQTIGSGVEDVEAMKALCHAWAARNRDRFTELDTLGDPPATMIGV
jgi:hypothetical protein